MQPGVSRAVPMGILGFAVGALLVIVIRALQSMNPVWESGVGLVGGALMAAFFFIWGIGAFDPRLSVHGEEHEHEAEAHAEPAGAQEARPFAILSSSIWQIATLLLIFIVVLTAFAFFPGGFTLTTTADPAASRTMLGFQEVAVVDLANFLAFFLSPPILLAPVIVAFVAFVVLFRGRRASWSTGEWGWRIALFLALTFGTMLFAIVWFGVFPGINQQSLYSSVATGAQTWMENAVGAETVLMSKAALFLGFIVLAFLTLAIVAAGIAFLIWAAAQGVAEAKVEAAQASARPALASASGGAFAVDPVALLPGAVDVSEEPPVAPEAPAVPARRGSRFIVYAVVAVVAFAILYPILFTGLIGPLVTFNIGLPELLVQALAALIALLLAHSIADTAQKSRTPTGQILAFVAAFVALYAVLFLPFRDVAIGLVVAQPEWLRINLTVANAALIALLILRPSLVLQGIGRVAKALARFMRALPRVLFQR